MEQKQVVIVFGATGYVGANICQKLAEAGYQVIVHFFKNKRKADQIVSKITEKGGRALAVQADATNQMEVQTLVQFTYRKFGFVHAVVNLIHRDDYPLREVREMEWEDWSCHLDAVKSYFYICKAVLPIMEKQHYGRIVYISGGLAYRFFKGCSAYSAAKAGMNAFSKSLANEVGSDGITVNIVSPGKVTAQDQEETMRFEEDRKSNCPLGRFTTPEDIAGAVMFFISAAAKQITGQTLYVSGGEIMPMP